MEKKNCTKDHFKEMDDTNTYLIDIKFKLNKMKNQTINIYKQAERFADLTKALIITGNISRAKKCFAVAEQLFETGSNETKNAISNVFLFSVSCFMELHKCNIRDLFPKSLQAEYTKQVCTSGI